jgi:hypothetical protein
LNNPTYAKLLKEEKIKSNNVTQNEEFTKVYLKVDTLYTPKEIRLNNTVLSIHHITIEGVSKSAEKTFPLKNIKSVTISDRPYHLIIRYIFYSKKGK